ncbi:hypothetical protein GCM10020254_74930 [Streptomyces goshikiensis]
MAFEAVGVVQPELEVVLGVGADEHAGAAAAQAGGVDAGALEGLPGGFQQQALLGVHGEGLARGDAEEGGVEVGCLVQEAALADVAGAFPVGVVAVEGVEVPAAVGGERGDAVAAFGEQLPQLLGRGDAAGEAAAHRDDGDRVVVVRGAGGPGGRPAGREAAPVGAAARVGVEVAEEFLAEVLREGGRRRVVEDEGGGQPAAGGLAEQVAQFDGGEGVEAELLEGAARLDGGGARVAERGGDLSPYEVEEHAVLLGGGEARQALSQAGAAGDGGRAARVPAGGDPYEPAEQRGQGAGLGLGAQAREVDAHQDRRGLVEPVREVEEVEAFRRGQRGAVRRGSCG